MVPVINMFWYKPELGIAIGEPSGLLETIKYKSSDVGICLNLDSKFNFLKNLLNNKLE